MSSLTYFPLGFTTSSAWVPSSNTFFSSITTILSESIMVDRRWAMAIQVRPFINLFNAFCTAFSDTVSKAAVASSRGKEEGKEEGREEGNEKRERRRTEGRKARRVKKRKREKREEEGEEQVS